MDKGIRIGKPPEPRAVRDFLQDQERMKDETMGMKKKIALIILPVLFFILCYGVYNGFFSDEPTRKSQTIPALEPGDDGGSREIITPEMLESISGTTRNNRGSPDHPDTYDLSSEFGWGQDSKMQVLRPSYGYGADGLNVLPIPPGSIIEAHIDGQVDTSSFSIPVVAVVDSALEYRGRELVPRDSRLFGQTAGIQAGNRVIIRFTKLVYPDGFTEFGFSGIARDEGNRIGIAGEVNENGVHKTGRSFASTVLGVGSGAMLGSNDSIFGDVARRTIENTTQDLSYGIARDGEGTESITVTLPPYAPIKVLVTEY